MRFSQLASEEQIQIAVAEALLWCKNGWRYTHIPAGEYRPIKVAMKLKRMGVKRGFPDFIFFHKGGRVCALELKRKLSARKSTQPSAEQFDLLTFLKLAGHDVAVADSVDLALVILRRWGVL